MYILVSVCNNAYDISEENKYVIYNWFNLIIIAIRYKIYVVNSNYSDFIDILMLYKYNRLRELPDNGNLFIIYKSFIPYNF